MESSGGSFWDPDHYKRTTKRVEDGFRLCNDFVAMLEERADIERNYAKSLQSWSKRWKESVDKGPEQGDMAKGWTALLQEAESVGEMHLNVKQGLEEYVIENIKLWIKDSYHKGLGGVKEKKELDEQFRRVQKPWAAQLARVTKSKSMYFDACRSHRKALKFKENGTLALSEEQMRKVDEKIHKADEEVAKTREAYSKCVEELDAMSSKYVEEMRDLFGRCQAKESQRLHFLTDTLVKIHRHIDVTRSSQLVAIYQRYIDKVQNLNHERDLLSWSNQMGDGMPFRQPRFCDYAEGPDQARKTGTLTRGSVPREAVYRSTTIPKSGSSTSSAAAAAAGGARSSTLPRVLPKTSSSAPVRVRALYDYLANASDELSLTAGDEFERLEDEDELGWSRGYKQGKIGLYPANYVQLLDK